MTDQDLVYVNEEAHDYHDRARDALHEAIEAIEADKLSSITLLYTIEGDEGMHQFNWGAPQILAASLYTSLNALLETLESLQVKEGETN